MKYQAFLKRRERENGLERRMSRLEFAHLLVGQADQREIRRRVSAGSVRDVPHYGGKRLMPAIGEVARFGFGQMASRPTPTRCQPRPVRLVQNNRRDLE